MVVVLHARSRRRAVGSAVVATLLVGCAVTLDPTATFSQPTSEIRPTPVPVVSAGRSDASTTADGEVTNDDAGVSTTRSDSGATPAPKEAGDIGGQPSPPAVLQLVGASPEPFATDVATDVDIELVFDRSVVASAGRFTLHRALDDGAFEVVDIDSAQVTLDGATMRVDLDGVLAGGTSYYVTLDAGALEGADGAKFEGLSVDDDLGFTTTLVTLPGAVDTPALWFDATFAASVKSDAGSVLVWGDRSGNNSTLSQSDPERQPWLADAAIGANPAVRFDGSSDVLEGPLLDALEEYDVFIVWQSPVDPPTGKNTHLLRNGSSLELNHGHQQDAFRHAGAALFSTAWVPAQFDPPATNTAYTWNLSFDSTARTLTSFTDGHESAAATDLSGLPVADADPLTVGSGWNHALYFTGDIGEILLYRRALTGTERASVQAYLDEKWGL